MKYSTQNSPMVCMMRQSTCYKGTTQGTPVGILWHDTAGGNPNIKRYVQPDDNASDKQELLQKIGINYSKNDWNHKYRNAGVNAFIGKLANGEVAAVQVLPWTYRPWGCGSGPNGSCNGRTNGAFWIQFEICDDAWSNAENKYSKGTKEYFDKVYKEAVELTAYLCKIYKINPKAEFIYNGKRVPTILCHQDSYQLGLGSNHSDIYGWFSKYGKTMADVRKDVAALLNPPASNPPAPEPTPTTTLAAGDLVSIKKGSTYYSGKSVPSWVFDKNWFIQSIKNDRVVLGKSEDGKANLVSAFKASSLTKIEVFKPYVVRIIANALNVRSGPGSSFPITTVVHKGDTYTIVEEKNGWGKLKSGAGWISLQYVERK